MLNKFIIIIIIIINYYYLEYIHTCIHTYSCILILYSICLILIFLQNGKLLKGKGHTVLATFTTSA